MGGIVPLTHGNALFGRRFLAYDHVRAIFLNGEVGGFKTIKDQGHRAGGGVNNVLAPGACAINRGVPAIAAVYYFVSGASEEDVAIGASVEGRRRAPRAGLDYNITLRSSRDRFVPTKQHP